MTCSTTEPHPPLSYRRLDPPEPRNWWWWSEAHCLAQGHFDRRVGGLIPSLHVKVYMSVDDLLYSVLCSRSKGFNNLSKLDSSVCFYLTAASRVSLFIHQSSEGGGGCIRGVGNHKPCQDKYTSAFTLQMRRLSLCLTPSLCANVCSARLIDDTLICSLSSVWIWGASHSDHSK